MMIAPTKYDKLEDNIYQLAPVRVFPLPLSQYFCLKCGQLLGEFDGSNSPQYT